MFRNTRVFPVTCVIACLVTIPWTPAAASAPQDFRPETAETRPAPGIREAALAIGATQSLQSRSLQTVASSNEPKLLLGVVAGALIVTGVAMIAYGATATCKGSQGEATNTCDKKTVMGAMALSGGTVMLVVWALSKP